MINIYTKNNCIQCKQTKLWLKNHSIGYHEINVDEDLSVLEYLISVDLRTLPVVFKDDEVIAMGFQPHKLKELV